MATNWIHAFYSTGCSGLVGYKFRGLRDVTIPLILAGVLGFLCLGIAGCGWLEGWLEGPDSELIGTYVGRYEGGRVEVFHVREDGTFDQTLSQEGKTIYRNQGTWAIKRRCLGLRRWAVFYDIMSPFEPQGGGPIKASQNWMPHFLGASYAGWSPLEGEIEFSQVIHVRKESSEVPPLDPDMPRMRDVYWKENTEKAVHCDP